MINLCKDQKAEARSSGWDSVPLQVFMFSRNYFSGFYCPIRPFQLMNQRLGSETTEAREASRLESFADM